MAMSNIAFVFNNNEFVTPKPYGIIIGTTLKKSLNYIIKTLVILN